MNTKQLYASFVNDYRQAWSARTAKIAEGIGSKFCHFRAFGQDPLGERTLRDIADFLQKLGETRTAKTIALYRVYMGQFFTWAHNYGHIPTNPYDDRKLPKLVIAASRRGVITFEQHQKIVDQADAYAPKWPWWGYAVRVGWLAGLRFSDVCMLKWECVDFEDGVIRIVPHKTRRYGKEIAMPMDDELKTYLLNLRQHPPQDWYLENEYIMPEMNMMYNDRNSCRTLYNQWDCICKKAGVSGVSFHCYRHAVFSRFVNSGMKSEVIADVTGVSPATVQTYTHCTLGTIHEGIKNARAYIEASKPKLNQTPPPVA